MLVTVVTMSSFRPGAPDPESIRENVWPGRTPLTEHMSIGAVPERFTTTSKPRICSSLIVEATCDGPAGTAFAVVARPTAVGLRRRS